MAVQRSTHPSADVLKAFAQGKLNDTSADVVVTHIDQCHECRQEIAKTSVDRTPVSHLPPELAANQQYEILRELGRGGMGVVYLAKNKLMDRLEVLKVVNKALLDHPGAVERFLREIRSAAKLSHANVVGAYHALQMGELLAFAMEYVEGQDLASLVKSQGPLPVPHACFYVQQAALGLQHAFEKGMVHRDIKPQNLILAREGKKHIVKVLDFGLAKVMREKSEDTGLTGEGKMLGTPDYIAPEQTLDAAKADIRADIYSLGCTLYYLLSGRPPFSATSLGAILLAHQMQEAKPLNLVRPEVPEELAAVVSKMMAKSPAKRYQTPLEVVQALNSFVKQGAVSKASSETQEAKPAAKETGKQPQPATVSGSLTEGRTASAGPRKSETIHKPSAAAGSERTSQQKWLIGGGVGVGVLLLALVGMWVGGVFKGKTKDGTLVKNEGEQAPPVDTPPPTTVRKDYDDLATGRWVAVLPSVEEFNRLVAAKSYVGTEPKYVGGVLECNGVSRLCFPSTQAKDVIVRAWMKKPGSKDVGNVGMTFSHDNSESECVGAGFRGDGQFFIGRKRNNSWKDYKTCQLPEPYDDFFEFVFAIVGDRLIAYANGRKILEAREDVPLDRPAVVHAGSSARSRGLVRNIEVQVLDKPPVEAKGPAEDRGFKPLFNGKDMTAWHVESGNPAQWTVEDNAIVAKSPDAAKRNYLLTNRDYADFTIRLQFMVEPDSFGAIALRAVEGENIGSNNLPDHPLIALMDPVKYKPPAGATGTAYWMQNGDDQYRRTTPTRTIQFATRTWHALEITMRAEHCIVLIDGHQLQDLRRSTLKSSKVIPALERTKGKIGFKSQIGTIRFRNIEIKELPATKSEIPPAASAAAEEKGFVPLFNGKDPKGWRTHPKQPGNWHVANGVLIGSGPAVSHLYSFRDNCKNFHLRVEARINDGGMGGVFFRAQFGSVFPTNNPGFPAGYVVRINSTHPKDDRRTGSLTIVEAEHVTHFKILKAPVAPGEWFTMEVIAEGNHLVIKVDGRKIQDLKDDKYTSGHIALQQLDAATVVEFRKIEIKERK